MEVGMRKSDNGYWMLVGAEWKSRAAGMRDEDIG
jgi:hypothetical protein